MALVFAGMKSYGQVDQAYLDAAVASCPAPTALSCGTADALHPLPGVTYLYDITVTAGSTIHWFVTTDLNVMATGNITASREAAPGTYMVSAGTTTAVGGNATYNDAANTGDKLEVTWNYFNPTTVVLLVAYAVDAAGCTDNVEVYKIEPIFNFTLDIVALEDDGTLQVPATPKECASPVVSATYVAPNLTMDYGDNYIYYVVTAANWVHSWNPTFVAPTSAGGSTVGAVEWAYADEAHLAATTWNAAGTPVLSSHYGGASAIGSTGACIVLRVNIDHNGANEMIAAETLTTGVNGVMYNAATTDYSNLALTDLDDNAGSCVNNITDDADYIISPRPDINPDTPTPFVTKN